MKIAIPVADGCLHPHFGGAQQFALVEIDPGRKEILGTDITNAPEHQPGLFPSWLHEQGVGVVIASGIGRRALSLFDRHRIQVCGGQSGAPVAELVQAYLNGQLGQPPAGCEGHGHHHHHHDH